MCNPNSLILWLEEEGQGFFWRQELAQVRVCPPGLGLTGHSILIFLSEPRLVSRGQWRPHPLRGLDTAAFFTNLSLESLSHHIPSGFAPC